LNCSKYGWVLVVMPSLALAQISVLGLQPNECNELISYFKLLLWGPIVEELIFRAGLQQWLSRKWRSKLWANVVSSCVFSLLHSLTTGQLIALWVFVPSILLGAFYSKSQSVILTIFLHAFFNLIYVLWACPILWFST
jgi:membrane protease YdiL (CAAX protease family)